MKFLLNNQIFDTDTKTIEVDTCSYQGKDYYETQKFETDDEFFDCLVKNAIKYGKNEVRDQIKKSIFGQKIT